MRIGQDDGPFSQFDNGVTTFQFGTGAWNGDAPDNFIGSGIVVFPFWSGIGAEYAVSKVVYFSPRFAGFDIAASFAPNNACQQRVELRRGRAQGAMRSRRRSPMRSAARTVRPTGMK